MTDNYDMTIEFDADTRIVSISASEKIFLLDDEDLTTYWEHMTAEISRVVGKERCFLLINLKKIIIDPKISSTYGKLARKFCQEYLYKNGVARYGFEVTRLTVLRASLESESSPSLFNSMQEAIKFLNSLPRIEPEFVS